MDCREPRTAFPLFLHISNGITLEWVFVAISSAMRVLGRRRTIHATYLLNFPRTNLVVPLPKILLSVDFKIHDHLVLNIAGATKSVNSFLAEQVEADFFRILARDLHDEINSLPIFTVF